MIYKLICIICLSSVPYIFSLRSDFVFDDSEAIVNNKDVYSNSWADTFSNDFWGTNIRSNSSHKSYRPLTILSFRLNYLQSGQKLVAYHFKITNLVCHVACSILAWQMYHKIFKTNIKDKDWLDEPFVSALLFSVHPIHVEAISGIVGRADILAGITFFLAFLAYEKAITNAATLKWLYLITAVVISGISMLCKENGVTVLGFCLIYEFVTKFKMKVERSKKPEPCLEADSVVRIFTVTVAALCLLWGRWAIMGGTQPEFQPIDNPAAFANNTFTRITTFNYIYFLNALLLVWPQWLCYDWSFGCIPLIGSINDYRIVPVVFIYLYGIFLLWSLVNNKNRHEMKRQVIMAASLLVIPFLPAANILYQVGFVIAERVLYISSAGYCALIAIGLAKIRRRKSFSKISVCLFSLLLLTFGLRSWQRSLEWRTEYLLFTSGLSVCPLNAKVHYNIAKVADANQSAVWALEEYRTAIRLHPEYYQAMNNLANLLKNLKQYNEAEHYLRKAISYKQDFPAAWMNLGIVLANTKRHKESQDAYKQALQYRRNYPDCYYNLGNLYLEMNKTDAAMETWLEAINLSSKHNLAWTNLLALLDNTGQFKKALQVIPKALMELPNSPSVNFAIANVYGKMDRYEDAERHFLNAIYLFNETVQAIHYANLGVLYHRWKKYGLAKEMYESALRIDPQFKSASRNLHSLLKHSKNK